MKWPSTHADDWRLLRCGLGLPQPFEMTEGLEHIVHGRCGKDSAPIPESVIHSRPLRRGPMENR